MRAVFVGPHVLVWIILASKGEAMSDRLAPEVQVSADGTLPRVAVGDLPLIVNTWPFTNATKEAWTVLSSGGSPLDAVEQGCSVCEREQSISSVGFGDHPDENGETTLDAMIMDGITHDVGSVGCLRRVKSAISVARAVMNYSSHTLLVGELATQFAVEMGFKEESLSTNKSINEWKQWKANNCQPNYRKNVLPDPSKSCGPYKPNTAGNFSSHTESQVDIDNHDTIGMLALDKNGNIAGGTSTNGMDHKVPGRVGDSPIIGAGCYVNNEVGGAVATGDGDIMMRFLPSFQAVESMKQGMSPSSACEAALKSIIKYYPNFSGALVAATKQGLHGGACYGFSNFQYTAYFTGLKLPKIISVSCLQSTK